MTYLAHSLVEIRAASVDRLAASNLTSVRAVSSVAQVANANNSKAEKLKRSQRLRRLRVSLRQQM